MNSEFAIVLKEKTELGYLKEIKDSLEKKNIFSVYIFDKKNYEENID